MHNWGQIYKQSLKNSLSSWSTWVIIIACLLVNAFFTAIMGPIVTGTPTSQGDSSPDMACTMITLCTTILAPFFGSILGEFNANANERIFVLSRPVSRETYLFAKIMSSLTITLVLAGFICLFIYISYVETLSLETWVQQRVFGRCSWWMLCIDILELTFFGSMIGTCLRYYFREIMVSIIILLAGMIYAITFAMVGTHGSDKFHFKLQYEILPPVLFVFTGIAIMCISFILNRKTNVGT